APMSRTVLESACAEARLTAAAAWLAARGEPRVTVVGASLEVASNVARRAVGATPRGAAFGWERTTLGMLAASLARPELARRGVVPASALALEAVCARVVHEARGKLGRFEPIGKLPGLPRALARTVTELRL